MTFRTVGTTGLIVVGILYIAQPSSIDAGPLPGVNPPPGSSRWQGPRNAIKMFRDESFRGESLILSLADRAPGRFMPIPRHFNDGISSLQWNLPPGVIVLFSERRDGSGVLFPIWGNYQNPRIKNWSVDNRISAWAWYKTY